MKAQATTRAWQFTKMNRALNALGLVGFLLCGCAAIEAPQRPIKGSLQLSSNWESASLEEHALILTPLRIAEEAPDSYRKLIESGNPKKDASGREILTVVGGDFCPDHKFILDRAAGEFLIIVMFKGFASVPLTTTCLRQNDGWYYSSPSSTPLNNRAEQNGGRQPAAPAESK